MDDLAKLQYLSLVSKVCAELDAHLGVSDKTLAEFIIDLAQKHPELGAFRAALDENGAEFPSSFASSLLALITKMMPKKRSAPAKASSSRAAGAGPQEQFSGLAVANDSDARRRELELEALGGGAVADPALGFDRRAGRDSRGGGGGGGNPNPTPTLTLALALALALTLTLTLALTLTRSEQHGRAGAAAPRGGPERASAARDDLPGPRLQRDGLRLLRAARGVQGPRGGPRAHLAHLAGAGDRTAPPEPEPQPWPWP